MKALFARGNGATTLYMDSAENLFLMESISRVAGSTTDSQAKVCTCGRMAECTRASSRTAYPKATVS